MCNIGSAASSATLASPSSPTTAPVSTFARLDFPVHLVRPAALGEGVDRAQGCLHLLWRVEQARRDARVRGGIGCHSRDDAALAKALNHFPWLQTTHVEADQ